MNIDIAQWMNTLVEKLEARFGERLAFVGLQGSRSRGEERADSDIDTVVIIEDMSTEDIVAYRELLADMPHSQFVCGFIASPDVLASWPRFDSINLVLDTKPVYGSLDFMDASFSRSDARASAKAGASEIYHAICHALAFDEPPLEYVVNTCAKSAFFVMRSSAYAETGEYPASRTRMKEIAREDERLLLEAYDDPASFGADALAQELLRYSRNVIAS